MTLDQTTLLLCYLGGGFVIALVWAALVGETLIGSRHRAVRGSVAALAVFGLVHPVAAVAAADLVRLGRTTDDAVLRFPAWCVAATRVIVVVAVVVTLVTWLGAPEAA
ncbi:hypothetical protein [Aquihabitans sp. McL0605]|uniref:hypothetical protein n=1 Tax=Aquihabitans sp. McL0605 TaxID=3415671 RepID=UPI003CED015F